MPPAESGSASSQLAAQDGIGLDVIVLVGGTSSRHDGADKTAAPFGASTVLDHLLDSLPSQWPVILVGPRRPTTRRVTWTREDPPLGGPVAALAAGIQLVTGAWIAVLAGDQPFAGAAIRDLATRRPDGRGPDALVAVDATGRRQPLLALYRTAALRAALPADPTGASLHAVLDRLTGIREIAVDPTALIDVDTPEALRAARKLLT